MKISLLLICCLALIASSLGLSLDPVASGELEEHIKSDFTISMRHIRPRRKFRISLEALFMIDFPSSRHRLTFYLDRKGKRITVDVQANAQVYSKHLEATEIDESTTIRSLVVQFQPNSVTLYIDCKDAAKQEIDMNLGKLYGNMEEPAVKLFRERKYPLHIDSTMDEAFTRANCQKLEKRKLMRKHLSDKPSKHKSKLYDSEGSSAGGSGGSGGGGSEKNRKRDIRDGYTYNQQRFREERFEMKNNNMLNRRGDIPILSGDCDESLVRAIGELKALILALRDDVSKQRKEIDHLRGLIENCYACQAPQQVQSACSSSPCFSGVECFEVNNGFECGPCPRGYIGNGRACKPGYTCADRPCFNGVQCMDTREGAQCGPCPPGYEGDGKTCHSRSACLDQPCAPGTTHPTYHVLVHKKK